MDRPSKITVIYNSVDEASPIIPPDRRVADQDTVLMAKDIAKALEKNFSVDLIEIPFTNPQEAASIKTDLVFNLCEGVGWDYACKVIEALDSAGIPYIGANSVNYRIGSDKALLKEFLNRNNLPTPKGQFFDGPNQKLNPRLKFPLIVKPELEHGSVGITQESVVGNEDELRAQLKNVLDNYGESAVAEEYIDGRELQLTLVGNGSGLSILPIKEILFVNGLSQKWHVVTFNAKWDEESAEYKATPSVCPVEDLEPEERETLENLGKEVFERTECQDYTRIDVRYDGKNKTPYILDVNPNPDISPDTAVAKAAAIYGWDYPELLDQIVLAAWKRVRGEKKGKLKEKRLQSGSFSFA